MQKQPGEMWGEEMKAKKFLKLIQKHCKEENCELGKCPLAVQMKDYVACMVSIELTKIWDTETIIKAVKKLEGKYGK